MSFIAKNPLVLPETYDTPPFPPKGTRGLFATAYGWYSIDSNGSVHRIADEEAVKKIVEDIVAVDTEVSFDSDNPISSRAVAEFVSEGYASNMSVMAFETGDRVAKRAECDSKGNNIFNTYATKEELINVKPEQLGRDAIKYEIDIHKYYDGLDVVPSDSSLFEFTVNDSDMTASVRGSESAMDCEHLVIPYEYIKNGKRYVVTEIEGAGFYGRTNLLSVIIPNTVTKIDNEAFWLCMSLSDVTMPQSVMTIGSLAFSECESLRNIVIPNGVKNIMSAAFSRCVYLETITIPDSVTLLENDVFWGCEQLRSVVIGGGVEHIGNDVFFECVSLETIVFKGNIKTIGDRAFFYCSTLEGVPIPSSVTTIGGYAFSGIDIKNVYYGGTREQWNNISMGDGNDFAYGVTIHYESTQSLVDEINVLKSKIKQLTTSPALKITRVNILSSGWTQIDNNLYSQGVDIEDITEYSKVDLQPTPEQLAIFYEKDVSFVVENNAGTITVYCVGQPPTNDYEIQATITEVYR